MLAFTIRPSKRLWLGAAALATALLGNSLLPHSASAAIGYCRTDPIVHLSDGTVVHMSAAINDDSSDVQQVTYTLHAPAGTSVANVVYTGGQHAVKETLNFVADETSGAYDTATVVSTGATNVHVTAETRVSGLGSASSTGQSGQAVTIHLAG